MGQRRISAIEIREHKTEKFSKVLRFSQLVPDGISRHLQSWIAVNNPGEISMYTIFKMNDRENLYKDIERKECEKCIQEKCIVLNVGQKCADWFLWSQFRKTGKSRSETIFKKFFENDEWHGYRQMRIKILWREIWVIGLLIFLGVGFQTKLVQNLWCRAAKMKEPSWIYYVAEMLSLVFLKLECCAVSINRTFRRHLTG